MQPNEDNLPQDLAEKIDSPAEHTAQAESQSAQAPETETEQQPQQGDIVSCLQSLIKVLQSIDSKIDKLGNTNAEPVVIEKEVEKIVKVEVPVEKEVEKIVKVEKIVIPDDVQALIKDFAPWKAFAEMVAKDAEMAELLISRDNYQQFTLNQQLPRLFANAAQWSKIMDVRDELGSRCKKAQRTATEAELTILTTCVQIHNFTLNDRQASLITEEVGADFDAKKHERGTTTGDSVSAVWLPGLRNAGGSVEKKVLVELE